MIRNISVLKRFLLENKGKQIYQFCTNQLNIAQAIKNKILLEKPQQILQVLEFDANNNFLNFSYSKKLFQNALQKKKYLANDILAQTIQKTCQYPQFYIEKKALQEFYKLVCDNIHLKTNIFLEKCLIFILHIDKNAIHSPIFIEFVKFYVKDFIQLIKVQLSIDLSQESISNGIKLLFLRILQRGFLSRKPPYSRELNIKNRYQVLIRLTENKSTSQTLMIKKVNFEIFMEIKHFYQNQMKENLYHQKNKILMRKITSIIKILCIPSYLTENQNKYLRQLTMKLFLANETLQSLKIIHLYQMWKQYSQGKNYQKSQLVQEFLSKIQSKFANLKIQNQNFLNEKEQLIKVLILFKLPSQTQFFFIQSIKKNLSSIFFKKHFDSLIVLIQKKQNLIKQLERFLLYEELTLDQIEYISIKLSGKSKQIKLNCLKSILNKDIVEIQGRQLQIFLNVYKYTKTDNSKQFLQNQQTLNIQNCRQTLIKFILRFLSDHHRQFSIKQFQKILKILFNTNEQQRNTSINFNQISFNDEENNYPDTIFCEMKEYIERISLMLEDNLKKCIQQFYQDKKNTNKKPSK